MKDCRRKGKKNKHHNVNRSRGGSNCVRNIWNLDCNRHAAWHLLFGNMSFQEVARMLMRAVEMKRNYYDRHQECFNPALKGG